MSFWVIYSKFLYSRKIVVCAFHNHNAIFRSVLSKKCIFVGIICGPQISGKHWNFVHTLRHFAFIEKFKTSKSEFSSFAYVFWDYQNPRNSKFLFIFVHIQLSIKFFNQHDVFRSNFRSIANEVLGWSAWYYFYNISNFVWKFEP